jgi:hypothetical protein
MSQYILSMRDAVTNASVQAERWDSKEKRFKNHIANLEEELAKLKIQNANARRENTESVSSIQSKLKEAKDHAHQIVRKYNDALDQSGQRHILRQTQTDRYLPPNMLSIDDIWILSTDRSYRGWDEESASQFPFLFSHLQGTHSCRRSDSFCSISLSLLRFARYAFMQVRA